MKLRIVVNYAPRYRRGHLFHFVPPVTGIHLAAITPREHEVEVIHEQVREVPVDDTPDLVALSFFSGFARNAYAIADRYRALGVPVVAGGPHVSYWVEEALQHVDAVVVGEAESVWPEVLRDFERGTPKRVYRGEALELTGLPTPRYDLLENRFLVPRVLQATRGCPFTCSFCSVPDLNPGFRVRPVDDVIRDITSSHFSLPWQEKVAWFWDDNLLVQRRWAKDLLRAMTGLDRQWLTQASIDIVKDRELLDLMERSGCIGIFLGIESLDEADLKSVDKRQNRVGEYKEAIARLHDRGICVMAGFISGFDDQDPEMIVPRGAARGPPDDVEPRLLARVGARSAGARGAAAQPGRDDVLGGDERILRIEAAHRQRAGAACGGGTGADNPPRSRGARRAAVADSPQPGGAGRRSQAVRALHSVLE